ncbi:MAG TPA: UvrB/UvrC motif-containing protein [Gemmatimonadales bacterium]|nr:UvrB/UvrC motif-containing protein [Gemmatimonadales bacterium]
MPCDQCREREAVIHLTQIVNEQVTTLHLCERCAAEKGVESPGGQPKTPLGSFLAAMGKGYPEQAPIARGADTCARCGASFQDFRESGRLGCSACYEAFESALRDLLRRLHGSTHHVGERYVDPGHPAGEERPPRVSDLREQLRVAVETENFELAAELRDRLRVME